MLFQRLIWAALAVALAVGSLQSALYQWKAVPLILAAEKFEDQKADPATMAQAQATAATALVDSHDHDHGHEHAPAPAHDHAHTHDAADGAASWAPQDGAERTFWTWVANVLHGLSMAVLVLVVMGAAVLKRGAPRHALALSLGVAFAGWLSLSLWPSLGLPAEVPGMEAAPLQSRQAWWLLAVARAVGACACVAALRAPWRWLLAAALLALPFVVGAPEIADPLAGFGPEARTTLQHLQQDFIVTTAWLAASLWLSLGLACGLAFRRWLEPALLALTGNQSPRPLTSQAG
jgi:cobalt transporter subunit CbtA